MLCIKIRDTAKPRVRGDSKIKKKLEPPKIKPRFCGLSGEKFGGGITYSPCLVNILRETLLGYGHNDFSPSCADSPLGSAGPSLRHAENLVPTPI